MCVSNDGLFYSIASSREGISNEHLQAVQKNLYGVNAIDKSTVSRWASRTAGSEKGQAELCDVRRSGRPTTAGTQASPQGVLKFKCKIPAPKG